MRRVAPYGLLIMFMLAPLLAVAVQDGGKPPAPATPAAAPFKPAMPHEALMEWHDRAFGQINLAVAQKEFERGEMNAWLLAELANVNLSHREEEEFRRYATQVRDMAVELAALLKKEDADKARALAARIDETCIACHDKYQHE